MVDRRLAIRLCQSLACFVFIFLGSITIWHQWNDSFSKNEPYEILQQLFSLNSTFKYQNSEMHLPLSDYDTLIDLNFTFSINNLICNDSQPPFLLVLVHSALNNKINRNRIRKLWNAPVDGVRILFMLGSTNNLTIQRVINEENTLNNDLIQGDFLDSYRNLTYKHVMALKYTAYHCPDVKYVLKTDDDTFINMPMLWNFLVNDLNPEGVNDLILCNSAPTLNVMRSYRSKWRVSFKEYAEKRYPPYCLGYFVLYSSNVVFDLYMEAQRNKYFWIDDVHVTGTLVEKIKKHHIFVDSFAISYSNLLENLKHDFCGKNFLVIKSGETKDYDKAVRFYFTRCSTSNSLFSKLNNIIK